MTDPSYIIPIENAEEIFDIPQTNFMSSVFFSEPNITKELLNHLLSGKPIVDISDGEYIHFFQLDGEAIEYLKLQNFET